MSGREGERPSYEELAAIVVGLTARLEELSVRVSDLEAENVWLAAENVVLRGEKHALRAENGELRRRLGLNSKKLVETAVVGWAGKPPPTSMRGRSDRKPGKQPGTSGTTLSQVPGCGRGGSAFPVGV